MVSVRLTRYIFFPDTVRATQRISTPGQIAAVSIADPYVLLQVDDTLRLYFADPSSHKLVETPFQSVLKQCKPGHLLSF